MPGIVSTSAEDYSAYDTARPVSLHPSRAFSEAPPLFPHHYDSRENHEETEPSLATGILTPPCSDYEAHSQTDGFYTSNPGRTYSSPLTPASEFGGIPASRDAREADFLAFEEIEEPEELRTEHSDLAQSSKLHAFPTHSESPRAATSTLEPSISRRLFNTGARHQTPPPNFSDRFISNRNSVQSPSKTFRLSKPPKELSGIERLHRDASSTPDPFTSPNVAHNRQSRLILFPPRRRYGGRGRSASVGSTFSGPSNVIRMPNRHASTGAIWNVGGNSATVPSSPVEGIPNGRGGLLSSGSNAPMYTSNFFEDEKSNQDHEYLEGRLAVALGIDRTTKLLSISQSFERPHSEYSPAGRKSQVPKGEPRTKWINGEWAWEGSPSLLDAPHLRDDYYCSVLAYCHTSHTLAVGLSNRVYLWSEAYGVEYPRMEETDERRTYVSSLSFSSTEGGHSILAIGRNNGQISLWSLYDSDGTRFKSQQPSPVSCVAFKPVTTPRPSQRFGSVVPTEELLVGDEVGIVYYYSIEWMSNQQSDIHGWQGAMNLLAKISVHSQQICGLSWSHDGEFFATGANDNGCCLFEVKDILAPPTPSVSSVAYDENPLQDYMTSGSGAMKGSSDPLDLALRSTSSPEVPGSPSPSSDVDRGETHRQKYVSDDDIIYIDEGREKHKWIHSAAIKAIAFCPWQRGLLATGGGSNDRAIHFYHTFSGACLATIDVHAQVTSLIWSTGRREIVATFGYAQPEHPYRIAVFSWPECKQILAIPWANDQRALLAISYPGGPNKMSSKAGEGETWGSRTAEEGCIVVACSDESVKFHEVWSGKRKSTVGHMGLLGGSDILESLEGIDKEGPEVIR